MPERIEYFTSFWHTAGRRQMKRKLEELNLLDDFLFGTLISHPVYGERFARVLVTTMLGREVKILKIVPQMTYYGQDTDRHGTRLDVYIEEEDGSAQGEIGIGNIYDVEPDQTIDVSERKALPRRVRFYRATIDAKNLQSGANYGQLKNVIIIMILPYDPFGYDRIVYTVKNHCVEEPQMAYDDGALSLFLYTKGKNGTISQQLKELLHYLEDTTWQNAVNDSLQEIQSMVDQVKRNKEVSISYMKIYERERMIRNEGMTEGLTKGLTTAKAEDIQILLSDLGAIPEDIKTQIENERDPATLSRWLKLAARAESVEEFTRQIS